MWLFSKPGLTLNRVNKWDTCVWCVNAVLVVLVQSCSPSAMETTIKILGRYVKQITNYLVISFHVFCASFVLFQSRCKGNGLRRTKIGPAFCHIIRLKINYPRTGGNNSENKPHWQYLAYQIEFDGWGIATKCNKMGHLHRLIIPSTKLSINKLNT